MRGSATAHPPWKVRYFRYLRYRAAQRRFPGSGKPLRIRYRDAPSATGPAATTPESVAAPSATRTPIRYLDHAPDQGGSGGSGSSGPDRKGARPPLPTCSTPRRGAMNSGQKNDALPPTYSPAQVAEALDCSEWWVKEQARRRRIPFIRSGSGYRFTRTHVEEIFHILEERPNQANTPVGKATPARRRTLAHRDGPVVQLRARRPRRARNAA
ncbi:helix-turn-helix domain-containing protein [Streptomyces sp. NPDC004096]